MIPYLYLQADREKNTRKTDSKTDNDSRFDSGENKILCPVLQKFEQRQEKKTNGVECFRLC